jgi:cell division protein FtsZ
MKNAGYAHMGVGSGTGRDKAEVAAKAAISSPILETSISGATGILINITASPDISLDEVETASAMISQEAHPDATIIWGAAFDNSLEDTIKVTVIATGFESIPTSSAKATRTNARPSAATSTMKRASDPWQFNTRSMNRAPAPQPIQHDDDDSLISNSEFDEIMSILKKNRG